MDLPGKWVHVSTEMDSRHRQCAGRRTARLTMCRWADVSMVQTSGVCSTANRSNRLDGGTENAGQENDVQKCKAGKCKTGKWRKLKVQGFRSFGVIFSLHDMTRWRRNKEQTPWCFVYDTVDTYGVLYHYDIVHTNARRHAALVLHTKCEHGFKEQRIVAITALLYTSNKRDRTYTFWLLFLRVFLLV